MSSLMEKGKNKSNVWYKLLPMLDKCVILKWDSNDRFNQFNETQNNLIVNMTNTLLVDWMLSHSGSSVYIIIFLKISHFFLNLVLPRPLERETLLYKCNRNDNHIKICIFISKLILKTIDQETNSVLCRMNILWVETLSEKEEWRQLLVWKV